jgi:hypothetical protein
MNLEKMPLILSMAGMAGGVMTEPPRLSNGTVTQKVQRDLVRVGQFAEGDSTFQITPDTLNELAANFARMKANGVKVAIPDSHEAAGIPDRNRGWLEDVAVDGDRLVGTMELVGEDAIAAARHGDVSVYVPPLYMDGRGNAYTRPILRVALSTPTAGGGRMAIAASQTAGGVTAARVLTMGAEDFAYQQAAAYARRMNAAK